MKLTEENLGSVFCFFFFSFSFLFRAPPTAHGGSQARGWVGAIAADLQHSSQQRQTHNPLSKARDRTRNLKDTSPMHFLCATTGSPAVCFLTSLFPDFKLYDKPVVIKTILYCFVCCFGYVFSGKGNKSNNKQMGLLKLKSFYSVKETIKKTKRPPTYWMGEDICKRYIR